MNAYYLNLAAHRQQRGITLEQIAAETRIGLHFLRAIESEDYGELPGGVYNTSYLRQYARATGFDEDELVQHYDCVTHPKPSLQDERAKRSFVQVVWNLRRNQHAV
jgi:cytoskeleton protein RodZ